MACRCLDLFRFDVNRLFNFVEATLLRATVAGDMGGDLKFLSVSVRLNFRVEADGAASQLNVQCAREKKCCERKHPAQAGSAASEVRRGSRKRRYSDHPPKCWPPHVDSGNDSKRVSHDRPEHGLTRGFQAKNWERRRSGRRDHTAAPQKNPLLPLVPHQLVPHQVHNTFQVVGLGKEIDHVYSLDVVAHAKQRHKVSGQRCRITRNIGNARRAQGRQ